MRTQTMPALKALLPAEVQAGIRPVNKLTSAGNQSSSIVTTSDELFLAAIWWERSPRSSDSTSFCHVNTVGGNSANIAIASIGVAFGFCF